jgi:hypothetical protein
MAVAHVFAGIPAADRDVAVRWFERFTSRPPDLIPNEDEAAWQLTDTGWIYLIVDPIRAGSALHTLLVGDLDDFLTGLAERGIAAGPVETIGDGCATRSSPTRTATASTWASRRKRAPSRAGCPGIIPLTQGRTSASLLSCGRL